MIDLLGGRLTCGEAERLRRLLAVLPLALLALAPVSALANTYRPTRTGDPPPNGCKPRDCSLREAITKANKHAGPDTIVLRGRKTYDLAHSASGPEDANLSGDLDVLGSIVIKSSNRRLATVDANGIDRVFQIGAGAPVSATFKRVRIHGGLGSSLEHGGGIDSEYGGTLKLIRSSVVGNRTNSEGGGIAADGGTLKLIRSVVAHNSATQPNRNAGGIEGEPGFAQNEVIVISRSRIVDNHAADNGGGIYAYNRLTINRSTIQGNTAGGGGGGIYNYGTAATITRSTISGNRAQTGAGGGVFNVQGTLRVLSSTLSGNVAANNDGGAIENYDTAKLVNDTITKNRAAGYGGGVEADASGPTTLNAVTIARNAGGTGGGIEGNLLEVRNSLIALNTSTGLGPDCRPNGPLTNGGHNLIGDTTDCTGIFGFATHDITNVNPRIAQLADNGGPTKTISLRRHSKAIDHAGSDAPSRDQRGVKRRVKGDRKPDIGAFERR